MRRLLFIGALALLVFPSEAFAHATLLRTTPQFRQRLPASPPTVVLRFDQYVKVLPQSVQLFSATHPLHVKRTWADGLSVKAALPRLPSLNMSARYANSPWKACTAIEQMLIG